MSTMGLQLIKIKFVLDYGSIKNVGTAAVDEIVKERKENGHKAPKMTPYDKRLYRGSR